MKNLNMTEFPRIGLNILRYKYNHLNHLIKSLRGAIVVDIHHSKGMSQDESIFRKLQIHLDTQPVGFPATNMCSDIRLLKYLFASEEVMIALKLNYKDQSIEDIYDLIKEKGILKEELERIISSMLKKGIIGLRERKRINYYRIILLIVGIDEPQVYNLTRIYLFMLRMLLWYIIFTKTYT